MRHGILAAAVLSACATSEPPMSKPEAVEIEEVVLTSGDVRARFLSYGLALTHLEYAGRNHVVSLPDHAYLGDHPYVGVVIGPVANRIADGRFAIDGKTFQLATNEKGNTLHSGPDGFHRQNWTVEDRSPTRAVFTHTMPDGHQGFPGPLQVRVTATVDTAGVALLYEATTARPTPVSLTHHTYFAAPNGTRTDDMELTINAQTVTRVDDELLPTDLESPLGASDPLDFANPRTIGATSIDNSYNIYPLLFASAQPTATVAMVTARSRDRSIVNTLRLESSLPALQIYTGELLTEAGQPARSGLALEPQFPPDLVNTARAEDVILRPGETYRHLIRYGIGTVDELIGN